MLLEIILIFAPMPLFWSLFDQMGSRWVEQANNMNGNIGSYKILPDQMQALNAFLDLVFIPMLDYLIYPILYKFGIRSLLQKLTIGGIFGAISFAVSAIVQWQVETSPHEVHLLWQVPQYIFISLGEILFTIPALLFSYEKSPDSIKTLVQALWLFTNAFGSAFVAIIASINYFNSLTYEFLFFAGIMLVDMMAFMRLAARFERREKSQN